MASFVYKTVETFLPETWRCGLRLPALLAGDKFHDLFLDYRLSASCG